MEKTQTEILIERINNSILSAEDKSDMLAVIHGEKPADLYRDAIAKKVFSPDEHPERLDFLLQRVMKDESIETLHSASNEGTLNSQFSKKITTIKFSQKLKIMIFITLYAMK